MQTHTNGNGNGKVAHCPNCQAMEQQLHAAERRLNEEYERRESEANEKMRYRREAQRLYKQLHDEKREDPINEKVKPLLNLWVQLMGKDPKRVKIPMEGKRADVVRKALTHSTYEECEKALRGLALRPYTGDGAVKGRITQKQADVHGGTRYDDVEHALRDEVTVERFCGYFDEATPKDDPQLAASLLRAQSHLSPGAVARLGELRGWTPEVIERYGLGRDGSRVVIPSRGPAGNLTGLIRYAPNPTTRDGAKSLATGKRELFPGPETFEDGVLWLCEGEPDALLLLSHGLQAVAVPGVQTWHEEWVQRFARFDKVLVVFDADDQGREAARKRARSLRAATSVRVLDIAPNRNDGYDASDFVREHGIKALQKKAEAAPEPSLFEDRAEAYQDPFDRVRRCLEELGQHVTPEKGDACMAQCPVHADKTPSLSLKRKKDGAVLLHCFGGCATEDILKKLGLSFNDLGAR